MIQQTEITLPAVKKGVHLITNSIQQYLKDLPDKGLLHVFIKHTSAGLTLNENADPSVRVDFNAILDNLVPENKSYYKHIFEGADDMPAHLKASLVGSAVTIPISNHHINLGTWQGIYLCEFREHGRRRTLVLTILS